MQDAQANVRTEIAPPLSAVLSSDDLIGREYQAADGVRSSSDSPNAPQLELQPGTKLGERYAIVRKLGQGGMGVVYEANNANVEHIRYAIKTLLPGKTKADAEHFLQEARRASKVRSKHIVRISDFGTDSSSGLTYMVMDYIGGDLENYVRTRGGTLPPLQAIEFCAQVCEALAAAHAEKVVHRDIKPLNCLVHVEAGQEVIVVTDFGIAREFRTAASTDAHGQTDSLWTAIGTPGYIAPEVWLREARADHRVDIYGVGAMLFRMLVGRSPPLAPTIEELRKSGIPDALLPVLSTALARSPKDRYASAKALQTALRGLQTLLTAVPNVVPARPHSSMRLYLLTSFTLCITIVSLIYVLRPQSASLDQPPVDPPAFTHTPNDKQPSPKAGITVDTSPTVIKADTPPAVIKPDTVPDIKVDTGAPKIPSTKIDSKVLKPSPRPKPLPAFAKVSSSFTVTLRNFCKLEIPDCSGKLNIKQQDLYRSKGSFLSRVGFLFSANVGDPVVTSKHENLDLKIEKVFKTCVDAKLRQLRLAPTSDGGSIECNVAL